MTEERESNAHYKHGEQVDEKGESLRALFQTMALGVVFQDADGRIILANPAAEQILGLTLDQMLGRTTVDSRWQALDEDGSQFPSDRYPAMVSLQTGREVRDAIMGIFNPAEDEYRWIKVNSRPLFQEGNNKPHQVYTTFEDITERKDVEAQLKESTRRLNHVLNATNTGFDIIDGEFNLRYVNPLWQDVYGDPKGRKCYEYFKGRDAPCKNCGIPEALETGKIAIREQTLPREGNRIVEVQSIPFKDQKGSLLVAEFKFDITERKRAEDELRERDEQLNKVITAAQDAIIMMDPQGNISLWNDSSERIFGYTADEAMGQDLHNLLAPTRYHDEHAKAFTEFCRSGTGNAVGKILELTALRKNGEEFPVELSLSAVYLKGGWHAIGVLRDITERKHAEDELRKTNLQLAEATQKAEAANRAKSDFLANMSHEIRTPMNVIIGMSDLLCNTEMTPQQREFAGMVRESAQSLLNIVNDILDFSKVEAGRLELDNRPFNIHTLVEKTLSPLAVRAKAKHLELLFHIEDDVPAVLVGDPNRLKQVLINIVGNAIKFTEAGNIMLTMKKVEKSHLVFSVKDTGPGIPVDKQDLLFQSFSQLDSSSTRKYEGTGLGLAISKKLVNLMGGNISVSSKAGEGSTFSFTLPLNLPLDEEIQYPPVMNESLKETQKTSKKERNLQILLVEDKPMNRKLATVLLENKGWDVTPAFNGRHALEILASRTFDLVLMDVQMPELDGLEATRRIRFMEKDNGGHLPIIAMTAHAMQGYREQCLEAGMDGYVSKPINGEELYRAIKEATGATGTGDRLQGDQEK